MNRQNISCLAYKGWNKILLIAIVFRALLNHAQPLRTDMACYGNGIIFIYYF